MSPGQSHRVYLLVVLAIAAVALVAYSTGPEWWKDEETVSPATNGLDRDLAEQGDRVDAPAVFPALEGTPSPQGTPSLQVEGPRPARLGRAEGRP